ncbi:hypothetical protein METUNv1_01226 [Methyloversatilis universalis FAM5]|uniref:Uncharacterized protein n=1 Tax=Methyloversatilis universalis (strain ATCC BAA-1314 / DSM 25237 / JCM 13912 / CCUG 52030 / FAM5) TaxID=1000565 RepID=F5RAL2_METUF|nr:hypothetical protein [Methyloversatilis universalis]EGK72461.1 hypothetical protein METUNv1_01226 [Methyloversatilis universalis FAM5]
MKRYSLQMQAGVPVELDHPGRFFTLLESVAPVTVSLQRAGKQAELLESITAGFWADFEDDPFTRVRIISPGPQTVSFLVSMVRTGVADMESGLPTITAASGTNPVVAGDAMPGWVSGDIANLAPSAGVTVIFDLGPHWDRYGVVSVSVFPQAPSSGLNAVQIYSGPNASTSSIRRLQHAFGSNWGSTFSNMASANGTNQTHVRPTGRYVMVYAVNADAANALGASSSVIIAAYPHS